MACPRPRCVRYVRCRVAAFAMQGGGPPRWDSVDGDLGRWEKVPKYFGLKQILMSQDPTPHQQSHLRCQFSSEIGHKSVCGAERSMPLLRSQDGVPAVNPVSTTLWMMRSRHVLSSSWCFGCRNCIRTLLVHCSSRGSFSRILVERTRDVRLSPWVVKHEEQIDASRKSGLGVSVLSGLFA